MWRTVMDSWGTGSCLYTAGGGLFVDWSSERKSAVHMEGGLETWKRD